MSGVAAILDEIAAAMAVAPDRGKIATYLPELARVDPSQFGISVALADGSQFRAGNADVPFSVQSVSKVFALALGLGRLGDQLWSRVGASRPALSSTRSSRLNITAASRAIRSSTPARSSHRCRPLKPRAVRISGRAFALHPDCGGG